MIYEVKLESLVFERIWHYEQCFFQLSQNYDDERLKLLYKKIKRDSVHMAKKFKKVKHKSNHFEKVETYYQLFVTIQLSLIKRKVKEIKPILKLLCSVPK